MAVFIKVAGDKVTLAGTIASEQMLQDGYFAYEGEIPVQGRMDSLRWNPETETIWEDLDHRLEQELTEIRKKRDEEIAKSDWRAARAAETGQPLPEAWATYRQALRDITDGYEVKTQVVWPTAPDAPPPAPDPLTFAANQSPPAEPV
jgi:hypothetical protein